MALDPSKYDLDEDATRLKDLLDQILEAVVSVYESARFPLPTRRYWTVGTAPTDCEQIVVSLVNLYLGAPGDQATVPLQCNAAKSAVVNIQISRPVPTVGQGGRPPSPESIQKAAEVSVIDSWLLMGNLEQFDLWGDGGPSLGVIATIAGTPPQGGYQTTSMQLTLAVP